MSSLLINGSVPTALQLAAIRSDLGLGSSLPGTASGVALLDSNADLPAVQLPSGMSPLGPYTTVALLEAAFPAASNPGKTAYVGVSAPYTEYVSNGTTGVTGWKSVVTAVLGTDNTSPIALAIGSNSIPLMGVNKRLVIFGSSNGAGLGCSTYVSEPTAANNWASPATSWAGLLKADLVPLGWEVINRSMSGTGTTAGIARFFTDVAPYRPSHVIICNHPINDGFNAALILKNTISLCQMCDMIGAVPIIRGAYMAPGMTATQVAEMISLNQQLDKLGRNRIDHWSTMCNGTTGAYAATGFDFGDSLHPNDAGYLELYREIDQNMFLNSQHILPNIDNRGSWNCDLSSPTGRSFTITSANNLPKPLSAFTMRARVKGYVGAAGARAMLATSDYDDGSGVMWRVRNASGYYSLAGDVQYGLDATINPTTEAVTRDLVMTGNPVTNKVAMWIDGVNIINSTPNQALTLRRSFSFGQRPDVSDGGCRGYSFADMSIWNVALSDRAIVDMYKSNRLQRGGLIFAGDQSNGPVNGGILNNLVPNGLHASYNAFIWTNIAPI